MTLLDELRRLRDEGPTQPLFGICSQVSWDLRNELSAHFVDMGRDPLYPVPATDGPGKTAALTAYTFADSAAMWDRTPGTYGANRWAFLNAMIERLEAQ